MYPYYQPNMFPRQNRGHENRERPTFDFPEKQTIYISDFEDNLHEASLFQHLQHYGKIVNIHKFYNKSSAVVVFEKEEEAKRALEQLNHKPLINKHVRVCKYTKETLAKQNQNNLFVKIDKTVTIQLLDDIIGKLSQFLSKEIKTVSSVEIHSTDDAKNALSAAFRENLVNFQGFISYESEAKLLVISESENWNVHDLKNSLCEGAWSILSKSNPGLNKETTVQNLSNDIKLGARSDILHGSLIVTAFVKEEDRKKAVEAFPASRVDRQLVLVSLKTPHCVIFRNEENESLALFERKICNAIPSRKVTIVSSKIKENEKGENLGYAYIQFDNKDEADRCKNREVDINGSTKIKQFTAEREKDNGEKDNVLYMRGFRAELKKEEIENILRAASGQANFVSLQTVPYKNSDRINYGLAYFKSKTVAENVLKAANESDDKLGLGAELYITVCVDSKNIVAIYTKNLLESVSEVQLLQAFNGFGITRCVLKTPESSSERYNKSQFAYLYFKKNDSNRTYHYNELLDKKNQHRALYEHLFSEKKCYFSNLIPRDRRGDRGRKTRKDMYYMNPYPFFPFPNRKFLPPQTYPPHHQQPFPAYYPQYPTFPGGFQNYYFNNFQHHQRNFNHYNRGMNQQVQPNYVQSNIVAQQNPGMNQKWNDQAGHYANNNQKPQVNNPNYRTNNNNANRGYQGAGRVKNYRGGHPGSGRYNNKQNQPNHTSGAQAQQQPARGEMTNIDQLKKNLQEFISLPKEEQRKLLGSLLFPKVQNFCSNEAQIPKITGMLVDFEVFEVNEILEFLENDVLLKERIDEALDLISQAS